MMRIAFLFVVGLVTFVIGEVVDVQKSAGQSGAAKYYACGSSSRSAMMARQGRIVKGNEAGENDNPFMASIRYRGTHMCNAFIIHRQLVITAAQCFLGNIDGTTFTSTATGDYGIVTGSRDLSAGSTSNVQMVIAFPVSQLQSLLPTIGNPIGDFAMFRSTTDFPNYGTKELPICLGRGINMDDRTAYFSGWGTSTKSGSSRAMENRMRTVQMKIQSKGSCNFKYYFNMKLTFSKRKVLNPLMKCARTNTFLGLVVEGPCEGDYGGPLYVSESSQQTALALFSNIGNNNQKCGQYLSPGIFTNVEYFIDLAVAIVTAIETGDSVENAAKNAITTLITTLTGVVASATG